MIGKVTGRLDHRGPDHVLIDTGGVGYVVQCSERTLAAMPQPGGIVSLYTDLIVREDLLQLIGFPSLAERDWHRLLTSVQGVGARVGLAILGRLTPEALGRALTLGDQAAIRSAPGVGPKLAVRIVTELKDKAPVLMATAHGANRVAEPGEDLPVIEAPAAAPAPAAKPRPAREVPATAEAISALSNLGYGFGEAAGAVAEVAEAEPGADTSALIRAALKRLAPKV